MTDSQFRELRALLLEVKAQQEAASLRSKSLEAAIHARFDALWDALVMPEGADSDISFEDLEAMLKSQPQHARCNDTE